MQICAFFCFSTTQTSLSAIGTASRNFKELGRSRLFLSVYIGLSTPACLQRRNRLTEKHTSKELTTHRNLYVQRAVRRRQGLAVGGDVNLHLQARIVSSLILSGNHHKMLLAKFCSGLLGRSIQEAMDPFFVYPLGKGNCKHPRRRRRRWWWWWC